MLEDKSWADGVEVAALLPLTLNARRLASTASQLLEGFKRKEENINEDYKKKQSVHCHNTSSIE